MKASEMIPNQKYRILNEIFIAIVKQENNYLCRHRKKRTYCTVPLDYDVIDVKLRRGMLKKEEIKKFIDYIKASGYWYEEKKAHLKFLCRMVQYKIYYTPQQVLVRNPILSIETGKKYANGYWAYKLDVFAKWFMQREAL